MAETLRVRRRRLDRWHRARVGLPRDLGTRLELGLLRARSRQTRMPIASK